MTEKYHNLRISYQSISIIDLFFCFTFLKYILKYFLNCECGFFFYIRNSLFSSANFLLSPCCCVLFLSGCEAQWQNLKLLMHQIIQQVIARSPKTDWDSWCQQPIKLLNIVLAELSIHMDHGFITIYIVTDFLIWRSW